MLAVFLKVPSEDIAIEIAFFDPDCRFTPLQRTHANISINFILPESMGYILDDDSMVVFSLKFRGGLQKTHYILKQSA